MGRKLSNTSQKYPQPLNQESAKVIKLKFIPQARTTGQGFYLESLRTCALTIGTGPAGSGKSFLSMAVGLEKLLSNEVERLVITRPVVEAGESLGFLPGSFEEKISPYLLPLLDAMNDLVGPTMAKKLLDTKKVEFAPLAYMRGRTFNNCLPADHLVLLEDDSYIRMDALVARFEGGEKLKVKSFNLTTSEVEVKDIQAAFKQPNEYKKLIKITLSDGTVIKATPDHKLYTKNRGYVPVNQLVVDDALLLITMKSARVTSIEILDSSEDVFDIMVEHNHNFFTNGGVLSSNCYVILDESQNTSIAQMKLFVTRIGEHSQFVVNGDVTQSDLHGQAENGLEWIVRRLRGKSSKINVIEFTHSDIQRSAIVKTILTHLDGPDDKPAKVIRSRHAFNED